MLSQKRWSRAAQLVAFAALLVTAGCEDDDSSPTGPTPVAGTPNAGTGTTPAAGNSNQVRGNERLAWHQTGDASKMRFRAYVDGKAVDLPAAKCDDAKPEAECTSPLPTLSNGVHTVEVVNIVSGVESARSAAITLEKVSSSLTLSTAVRYGVDGAASSVVTLADGTSYTTDVVATGVQAPAQLAWLPGGRLLLSEADGRVRMVRPGEPESGELALDAGMLNMQPLGPLGIATHPDFAQNRLVYVSLLERARDGVRLRVVRLREVGDTLGEPATLFEAPVVVNEPQESVAQDGGDAAAAGPRMAFGPDRLLYLMLPYQMEFAGEPTASTPRASMLRLSDQGRADGIEPLTGVTSSPLAFSWNRATGALVLMSRGGDGNAVVRSLESRARVQARSADSVRLRAREGIGAAAGTLILQSRDDLLVARALLGARVNSGDMARLAMPVKAAGTLSDRIGDVLAGDDGTLFLVTQNARPGGDQATADVVRLTPVAPSE